MAGRDGISQLPIEILDHIMGLLPIQQAAQTAVLSKACRDVWSSLSQLSFDYHFTYFDDSKFSCFDVVDKVLLQHKGHIRKFVFHPSFQRCVGIEMVKSRLSDMDQWLLLLTSQGVEEIHLHFAFREYNPPDCIFSCPTLVILRVCHLFIEEQNFPWALPNATSIQFQSVCFGRGTSSNYTLDVPKLENLSFYNCAGVFHFNITTRNLNTLRFQYFPSCRDRVDKPFPVNLDTTCIRILDLCGYALKGLPLQMPLLNLEILELSRLGFMDDERTSEFLNLLLQCPKLSNLIIRFPPSHLQEIKIDVTLKILEELRSIMRTRKMLLFLKLYNFRGSRSQMHFVEEMLACLPALEKVVIRGLYRSVNPIFMERVLKYPRASAKVEIVYE